MTQNAFQQELRIIEHMNKNHADALRDYAGGAPSVMTSIDAEGFDLLVSGRKLRLEPKTPIHDMEQARQALVAMTKRSR